MGRQITLSSEEVAIITLAIQDKINNTRIAAEVSGITLSKNTERRLHFMIEIVKKLNQWKVRTKTPQEINEQLVRIMNYYFCPKNRADEEVRERTAHKIAKLSKTAMTYIDNIYKVAKVSRTHALTSEVNQVWLYFKATKEQYTNNRL